MSFFEVGDTVRMKGGFRNNYHPFRGCLVCIATKSYGKNNVISIIENEGSSFNSMSLAMYDSKRFYYARKILTERKKNEI